MIRQLVCAAFLSMLTASCTAVMANSTATELKALADAMNERHMSHCLYMQAAAPPYGHMTLLAGSGDWDCIALWEKAGRPPM